ncbi:protein translocase subunit SecY [Planctomycetales bacterium]|nr:protein translocase subunit SecY [Planctomycetales bacterium]GHS99777.1 protein translocase subunit SecY [Planctomycetales bacterium]GHT07230.1 protein translocase subunit SecY [Planctomycetales bacterium]GHV18543.1 protein translocase subunit SecY [Planctomycetales bacterium]
MFETIAKVVSVKDLRGKIIATALLLVVFRLGKFIPLPGIDYNVVTKFIDDMSASGDASALVFSMADMFSGGAMGSIFSLGIMPYITASIIFQLLVAIVPSLARISREGASGRKRINQYTRVSTVLLCIVQAVMACSILLSQSGKYGGVNFVVPGITSYEFYFFGVIGLTVGTVFLMWLGEQIDTFGIGNGISLLIMAGIISSMPSAISTTIISTFGKQGGMTTFKVSLLIVLFVLMTLAVVLITLGTRRVSVQASKAMRGRKVYMNQRQFLPLRVNQAGVIPIIFAQAIMALPAFFFGFIDGKFGTQSSIFFAPGAFWYTVFYVLLIVFFCYFYTAITFNPNEMADNLKQSGMYLPGIRPGQRTAEHLEKIMTRIALAGSVFLAFIAIVPQFISRALNVDYTIAGMLGGTGLLIVVGVALDVVQRVESYLLMRNYEGFGIGDGRIHGRNG